MAHHAYMVSHQHAIYIYVSPNSLLASPTHLFVSCLDFFCSPFVVDVYFVVTLSRETGASTFQPPGAVKVSKQITMNCFCSIGEFIDRPTPSSYLSLLDRAHNLYRMIN